MKKKNWIVRMKCEVLKDIYVDNCTEEEARNNTFKYSTGEQEVELFNWEVTSVEPNE